MRHLLRLSLAFAVVAVLLALVGLLLPRTYQVSGAISIAASPTEVYPLIADLARWREWSPRVAGDPGFSATFSPRTTGVGAWTQWSTGGREGGRAEITASVPPETLSYQMAYAGVPVENQGTFTLVATNGGRGVSVTWTCEGRVGWSPLARWFGLLLRRIESREIEDGLASLRNSVERGAAPAKSS
jgi:uncharacterized protein YndB with AHSA1/START domain